MEKKDIKQASIILAEAFHSDPIWVHILSSEDTRKEKLPVAFETVLKYGLRYGTVITTSSRLEGIGILLPHDKVDMTIWRMLRSGAFRSGIKLGQITSKRIQELFKPLDADRSILS
ncbi:MAG: hypothetical protein ACTSP4_17345 [Candidatus Hodarchaeales archaeon]